jgi:2,3-bisphosphoglycerate-dependent phosphoglycerate mutase
VTDTQVLLHLVRHGQTTWNAESRLAGWTDVALTEFGREQARSLQPRLSGRSFDRVWSSDLQRAVHTARLAFGEPEQDERLREIHFGELEGEAWPELDPAWREPLARFSGFDPPGGESIEVLGARLTAFADQLNSGQHLVFAHGGVIRWFMHGLSDHPFVQNGTLVTVRWTQPRAVLKVETLA